MDGRFEVRREELLTQTRVLAEDWVGVSERLEQFVEPFVGGADGGGAAAAFRRVFGGVVVEFGTEDRRGDRVLVRAGPEADATVRGQVAVGARAVAGGVGAAGRTADRRGRWRDRARPAL